MNTIVYAAKQAYSNGLYNQCRYIREDIKRFGFEYLKSDYVYCCERCCFSTEDQSCNNPFGRNDCHGGYWRVKE